MPMYVCPTGGCKLTLKFGEKALCPLTGEELVSRPATGLAVNWSTGCQREGISEKRFAGATFALQGFVPMTRRGLFDCGITIGGSQVVVTVRVFPTFLMPTPISSGPKVIVEGYSKLTPWTQQEQTQWQLEQQHAVGKVWNKGLYHLSCKVPGWKPIRLNLEFRIQFTKKKTDAHIIADVFKNPPIVPEFFNCGGTFVGLDQIIQGNPNSASKAVLSSQSGQPVKIASDLLGYKVAGMAVLYNIIAHEYGHMIGLPDEYNSGIATKGGTEAQNAYAIHADATDKLAALARLNWIWNSSSQSLMSKGDQLLPRHLITVWEAVVAATSGYTQARDWTIA